MVLQIHNSLTRKKEVFTPIDPQHVRMYVCGPTVYDRAHLGNARSALAFDQWYRLLRVLYPRVTYVRNITDVDDKINQAAREQNVPIQEVTERTTQWFHEDMACLNILPPTLEPRATHHIGEMIQMIAQLVTKDHAYPAEGHVLFRVASFASYGQLSGCDQEEMLAGARVEVAPYKENPYDFVLWKPSSDLDPGWDSPWGRGRPGWHIECSAMAATHLGCPFDLHGGGHDLLFPHHENEMAQGECAVGTSYARFWLHNGFLIVNGQKMSKSLGNFMILSDLMETIPGEVIRYALLSSHYRKNLDWTPQLAHQSYEALNRFYQIFKRAEAEGISSEEALLEETPHEMIKILSDDLNTPLALSYIHGLVTSLNKEWSASLYKEFASSCRLLGLGQYTVAEWFQNPLTAKGVEADRNDGPDEAWILEQIAARAEAKKAKDFQQADAIRQHLLACGIVLEDGKDGITQWQRRLVVK